jgi:hypothetical protein
MQTKPNVNYLLLGARNFSTTAASSASTAPTTVASSVSTAPMTSATTALRTSHRASQSPRHRASHSQYNQKNFQTSKLDVWQLYKNSFGRTIVRPKHSSAEQSFGRTIVRPNNLSAEIFFGRKTYCRKENIRPTKFLHANRGPGYGSVRFDVYVFGRTIVRPKIRSFGRKRYLVRPKICFSKFWRPDCHESVTHLRDSTQLPHFLNCKMFLWKNWVRSIMHTCWILLDHPR